MSFSQANSRGRLLRFLSDNLGQEIASGSSAGGASFLAVNTDQNLVLAEPAGGGGGGISWDGSTANGVATYKNASEASVEANLTFDGATLTVAEPATAVSTVVLGRKTGQCSIKAPSSEHMVIDSTGQYLSLNHFENDDVVLGYGGGHVSIGTNNSPDYLLEVSSETAYEGVAAVTQYNNSNAVDGSNLYLRRARGTMSSPTIVQEDDNIGGIRWYSYNGSDWDLSGEIKVECDATPGADDTPGRIVFSTTPDNDDSLTERMRIDSAGLVTMAGDLTVTGGDITLGAATSYIKDSGGDNRIKIDANYVYLLDNGGASEFYVTDGECKAYGNFLVDGNTTLGNAGSDVSTVTAQLTGSEGALLNDRVGIFDNGGIITNPSYPLDIVKAAEDASSVTQVLRLGATGAGLNLTSANGTGMQFWIPHNTTTVIGAQIIAQRESNTDTNTATGLAFWTHPDNDNTGAEKMRIESAGDVGIGTTNPSYKLDVDGDVNLSDGQTLRIGGVYCVNHTTNTVTVGSTAGSKALNLDVDAGTALAIDSYGNITKPLQPAFFAYRSGDQSNTQTEAWGWLAFNAERFDVGADFDPSTTYAFTAPETGKYFFKCQVRLDAVEYWWDYIWMRLNISDSRYVYGDITSWQTGGPGEGSVDAPYWTWQMSALLDLSASEWVRPELIAYNGTGNTTTWIMNGDGDGASPRSYFTGWLVG